MQANGTLRTFLALRETVEESKDAAEDQPSCMTVLYIPLSQPPEIQQAFFEQI